MLHCIGLADLDALEVFLSLSELQHLLFDLGEIRFGKGGPGEVHIIVETILDGGTDSEFHTGIEAFEGLCHKVGRRMPENVLGFFVFPFMQLYLGVRGYGTHQIVDFTIHACRKNFCCKTGRDALSNFIGSDAAFEGLYAAVGESNVNHSAIYI